MSEDTLKSADSNAYRGIVAIVMEKLQNVSKVQHYYCHMPDRSVNPSRWDDQLQFWTSIIRRWAADFRVLDFVLPFLVRALRYEGMLPPLTPSISALVSQGIIEPYDQVLRKKGWFERLFSSGVKADRYVFVRSIEDEIRRCAQKVQLSVAVQSDCLVTWDVLRAAVSIDQELLMEVAKRLTKVCITYPFGVFFRTPAFGNPQPAAESVLRMKASINILQLNVTRLQTRISQEVERAKVLGLAGRITEAKLLLGRKRALEGQLKTMQDLLTQTEDILSRVAAAEMSHAFTTQVRGLVQTLPKVDLGKSDVAMSQVAEMVGDIDDGNQLFSEIVKPTQEDPELEAELANLLGAPLAQEPKVEAAALGQRPVENLG